MRKHQIHCLRWKFTTSGESYGEKQDWASSLDSVRSGVFHQAGLLSYNKLEMAYLCASPDMQKKAKVLLCEILHFSFRHQHSHYVIVSVVEGFPTAN